MSSLSSGAAGFAAARPAPLAFEFAPAAVGFHFVDFRRFACDRVMAGDGAVLLPVALPVVGVRACVEAEALAFSAFGFDSALKMRSCDLRSRPSRSATGA